MRFDELSVGDVFRDEEKCLWQKTRQNYAEFRPAAGYDFRLGAYWNTGDFVVPQPIEELEAL